jgi:uroporphyrinogen-III synthase
MHILVTRPESDASELKAQLEAQGHAVTIEPLLQIEPILIDAEAVHGAQAVVATSRNALHALTDSPARHTALKLPIFAVGPSTAELARKLGFARIIEGAGTARDLVPLIAGEIEPASGPVVHLAGESLAFDLAAALEGEGIAVRKVIVYRAHMSKTLTTQTAQMIAKGVLDAVVLMSPRTAAVFAELVAAVGLKESALRLTYLCLSRAVARSLQSLGAVRAEVAAEPNTAEIVSLAGRVATRRSGV